MGTFKDGSTVYLQQLIYRCIYMQVCLKHKYNVNLVTIRALYRIVNLNASALRPLNIKGE